ncbi:MAG: lipoyl(octanoyl) transferase LipB [Spirochaetota bacterium]
MSMTGIEATWAGMLDYDQAWDMQKALVEERRQDPGLPDRLLLLEHPPTYTLGRRGDPSHLLLSQAQLDEKGFSLRRVDRGGDITYHGPGQLVGYPIMNLRRLFAQRGASHPDMRRYLRDIEEVLIRALAVIGIAGFRIEGLTGVWVEGAGGSEKIAAIGVKVDGEGISSHGFALNVTPDLGHFSNIIPCGIRDHGVTSIAKYQGRWPDKALISVKDMLDPVIRAFSEVFRVCPEREGRRLSSEGLPLLLAGVDAT